MSIQKYFIAIVIPEPFQKEVMALKQLVMDRYNSKAALRSPAHITLHMPFEWKEEKESILIETLQQFSFKKDFKIELHDFYCFEPRVIFIDILKNELLAELQRNLVSYVKRNLQLFNQADDMRGFHPHVTIAFRDLRKENFYEAYTYFKTQNYTASFNVTNYCLLKHTEKEWKIHKEFSIS
jgi:2'-5' RNA ligase